MPVSDPEVQLDTDVLIVGAGPTGLMLALQLVRRGIRVTIIDRHAGPSLQTRALGVQARTMEIYAQLGLADRALEFGKPGYGANIWALGQRMAHIPIGDAGQSISPYPFILVLGQDDNERIMGEKLGELGVSVAWNTELVELAQKPDRVTATFKSADGGSRTIVAGWVAGCDGAGSTVRRLTGITFPGEPYEHVFFVADVTMTGPMIADEVNVYLWREGFHLLFPMRGKDHWRIVGILPANLRDRADANLEAVLPSLRGNVGSDISIGACTWFSTYRIHHRCASRFRDGRCFLLGDAAHIHSPMGAQGMNTGLQDAYNLAWKLALVVQGRAGEALVGSYQDERLPVARRLLATTDRAFRLAVSDSWLAGLLRTKILARLAALAMSVRRIQTFAFRTISQTAIEYRKSALSRSLDDLPRGAPTAGDRFPWLRLKLRGDGPVEDMFQQAADTHFNLLLFGQAAPSGNLPELDVMLKIHVIPPDPANDAELARAHIPQPSFYLLRPDGHVGLCGARLETAAIRDYLAEILHIAI